VGGTCVQGLNRCSLAARSNQPPASEAKVRAVPTPWRSTKVPGADVPQTDPMLLANIHWILGLFSASIFFRSGPCVGASAGGCNFRVAHPLDKGRELSESDMRAPLM